jgi:hypothetical protein
MKFSIKTLTLLGLATLAALVVAADGTSLKYAPKEGTSRKYKLSAVFDAGGTSANVTGEVTEKISKVDAATGDVTEERLQGALTVDVGGQTIPVDAGPPSTMVYHADGSLVEIRGEGLNPSTYRLATLSTVRFPKDPVAADGTWKVEIPANEKTGVVKTNAEYKVLGMEKLMGIDTIKISSSVKEAEGDAPASSEGIVWINVADGTVVKFDGTWTNAPVAPAPMPVSGKYTLTLIP